MLIKVIGCVLLLFTWTKADILSLDEIVTWKQLEFKFPTDSDREQAIETGQYVPYHGTPIDVGVNYRPDGMRLFVTVPRFTNGIPFTLATITDEVDLNGPYIAPYPDYESNHVNNSNCDGVISAFRLAIDECNHMWVIDSGFVEDTQVCPPQLLVFDLTTDELIKRFQFDTNVYEPGMSLLISLIVDIDDPPPSGQCQNAMVYLADSDHFGLVVYDSQQDVAWRVENQLMKPDPNWENQTIEGESFVLNDGIFAINLTPRDIEGERLLYFHALASDAENAVPLSLINNRTIWEENPGAMPEEFKTLGNRGVQSAMEAIDSKGNIFTNTHNTNIFVWDIDTPYTEESFRIVANNPDQLQFASGMKVVRDPNGEEELWVTTTRFQKIMTGTQDPEETNYRIMTCKISELLSAKGNSTTTESYY